jgi:flagellar assembly protein FliH
MTMSSSPEWRPGEPVLRGGAAEQVNAVSFGVDLRRGVPADSEAVAKAKEEARTAGFAAGWAQGQREAAVAAQAAHDQQATAEQRRAAQRAAATEQAIVALGRAAAGLEARTAATVEQIENLIAEYAVQLAEAIVGRELADPAHRGVDAIRRVLADAPTTSPVTVSLHPDDHAALDNAGEYEVDGRTVRLRPSPAVRPGDAVAEVGAMTIDATVAAAVARVREALGR